VLIYNIQGIQIAHMLERTW